MHVLAASPGPGLDSEAATDTGKRPASTIMTRPASVALASGDNHDEKENNASDGRPAPGGGDSGEGGCRASSNCFTFRSTPRRRSSRASRPRHYAHQSFLESFHTASIQRLSVLELTAPAWYLMPPRRFPSAGFRKAAAQRQHKWSMHGVAKTITTIASFSR